MAEEKKKWWKKVFGGDVLAAIAGGLLGAKLAETNLKAKVLEEVGNGIRKQLTPNREEVMKELLLLDENGAALVELLEEANNKRFFPLGKKRYPENWIINMLLKIPLEDRPWVYPILNRICKKNREKFFTHLEILCNDGFLQWAVVSKESIKDGLKKISEAMPKKDKIISTLKDADKAICTQLSALNDLLEKRRVKR